MEGCRQKLLKFTGKRKGGLGLGRLEREDIQQIIQVFREVRERSTKEKAGKNCRKLGVHVIDALRSHRIKLAIVV